MVHGADSASADFKKLQQSLAHYSDIRIILSNDFASNYFEVEYNLKGFISLPDKTIIQDTNHRISITLPFGYPHFAPTVKPLTSIFHPDIDPDAIRIADFWEENKALDKLIVYIAKMICGDVYNVESPFNIEAAEWFMDNIQILPIDTLRENDDDSINSEINLNSDDIEETFSIGPGMDLTPESPMKENSNLDNLFTDLEVEKGAKSFNSDSNKLELESLSEKPVITLNQIKQKVKNKNFYTAAKLLKKLSEDTSEIERSVIEKEIFEVITTCNDIYKKIEDYESEGELKEAKNLVDQLARTTIDFPNFNNIKARVRDNFALTMSLKLKEKKKGTLSPDHENFAEFDTDQPDEKETLDKPIKKNKFSFTLPTFTKKLPGFSFKSISLVLVLTAICFSGVLFYIKDKNNISQANIYWKQAQEFDKQNRYSEAKKSAEEALSLLSSILFLQSEKNNLQEVINKLLSSKTFIENLKGRVLHNGEYISIELASILTQFDTLVQNAEKTYEQGKHEEALKKYQEAHNFALKNNLKAKAVLTGQKVNFINLENTLADARLSAQNKEWDNAAETYIRALELARSLSDKKNETEITKQIAASKFRNELNQSKEAFAESQWLQTLEILSRAEQLLQDDPTAVSKAERIQLEHLRHNSELYQILNIAGTAYRQRNWPLAIKEYENGLELLENYKESFGEFQSSNSAKIKKTLLMVRVSAKLSEAAKAYEKKDLQSALLNYEVLTTMLRSSEFGDSQEFQNILQNTEAQIAGVKEELDIQNKTDWLTENFKNIFMEYYPSTSSSELLSPKVTFIKKDETIFLFKLSCVERKQGRSFRLELDYQYSPKKDSWTIYTGK